jgi:hypothetical protein
VAVCQTCGQSFDERGYQIIVWGLGAFDSVECAEKAMRRQSRQASLAEELARELSGLTSEMAPPTPSDLDAEKRAG